MQTNTEILPMDKFNTDLLENVHPKNYVNPEPQDRYNLVVIGAGTAGLVTAAGAAGLGAKVALIERHLMGGDCLNVGCVPSKAVIRAGRVAHEMRYGHDFGVHCSNEGSKPDFAKAMQRMRRIRSSISGHDSVKRFSSLGIDVFLGDASFSGPNTIIVEDKELKFKKAVIATGAKAFAPPIEGLSKAGFLTNETIFSLTQRPEKLAVIGGGPIGCELSQAFRRLGSEVTIIEKGPQFLSREDRDAAAILEERFKKEGLKVVLDADIERVSTNSSKKLIHIKANNERLTIEANEILVGAGRAPNTEGLELEKAGVDFDKYGVKVNERLRTTNKRIFAAGDICSRFKFTHTADAAARIVIQNALFAGRKKYSDLNIPWCTYTDPEIAHVGMYEKDAKAQGIETDTYTVEMSGVDRAVTDGQDIGFVKIHVKKGTDRILGATIVASHAGDLISQISVAMAGNMGLGSISGVIHPYPTQAEAIKKAADAYNRTRLKPFLKNIFTKWFKWVR